MFNKSNNKILSIFLSCSLSFFNLNNYVHAEYTQVYEFNESDESFEDSSNINVINTDLNLNLISLGDLNGNNLVDVDDASIILEIYAKRAAGLTVQLSEQEFQCADCNHNNEIDVDDASLVLDYYAKNAAGLLSCNFSEYVDELQRQPVTTTIATDITTPIITTETTTTEITSTDISSEITTTIETTITTTESTTEIVTTTTVIPDSLQLPVSCILQNATPSLLTGCEATALTIALNYSGFSADKVDIAKMYLPKMCFYTINNIYYGADFQYVFPGDPTTYYGYGCYAPAIVATADAYFTANKNASYAQNISGTEFEDLFKYISNGQPVIFWATMGMCEPTMGGSWTTPDGKSVSWVGQEHCLVLTGYDKYTRTVQIADPLQGNISYDIDLVKQRYEQMGKNAVILHTTENEKVGADGIIDGGVYKLRNSGSNLYLTVADGVDADKTNLIQSAENNTLSQQFRISYDEESNSYKLFAMCSSYGTNRVIDIVKLGGGIVSGCNVEIYSPVDINAQTFVITLNQDDTFVLSCRTNRSACLSVYGLLEGSVFGTGFYDDGNAVIQNYNGENTQHWILEKVEE